MNRTKKEFKQKKKNEKDKRNMEHSTTHTMLVSSK